MYIYTHVHTININTADDLRDLIRHSRLPEVSARCANASMSRACVPPLSEYGTEDSSAMLTPHDGDRELARNTAASPSRPSSESTSGILRPVRSLHDPRYSTKITWRRVEGVISRNAES